MSDNYDLDTHGFELGKVFFEMPMLRIEPRAAGCEMRMLYCVLCGPLWDNPLIRFNGGAQNESIKLQSTVRATIYR